LYNHQIENITSDESSAFLYEYKHEDNGQSIGNDNDLEVKNTEDNMNAMYTRKDFQSPLVEVAAECMVDK